MKKAQTPAYLRFKEINDKLITLFQSADFKAFANKLTRLPKDYSEINEQLKHYLDKNGFIKAKSFEEFSDWFYFRYENNIDRSLELKPYHFYEFHLYIEKCLLDKNWTLYKEFDITPEWEKDSLFSSESIEKINELNSKEKIFEPLDIEQLSKALNDPGNYGNLIKVKELKKTTYKRLILELEVDKGREWSEKISNVSIEGGYKELGKRRSTLVKRLNIP